MRELARRGWTRARTAFGELTGDERGDVPGWVLITLMTAGLQAVTSSGQISPSSRVMRVLVPVGGARLR